VEVLGWLYQFYIAERKDEVMARKSAVPTEDIPAVTQLFTRTGSSATSSRTPWAGSGC